jgi:GntR family transcriptional regulator, transcriptional repressor for pyruvate dehydrogenase complex
MEIEKIQKIQRKTVVTTAMERMKELIASGQFKINERIPPEQELADMFGIARSSMREVIKTLHYLGVLESQTGRGTYVCNRDKISTEALTWSILLGENSIFEMIQLREVLEQAGIQTLEESLKSDPSSVAELLAELERETENMKKAVEYRDIEALILADYSFHGAFIKGSKNTLFTAIYQTLKAFMHEVIKNTYRETNFEKVVAEHVEFVDTIKSGNIRRTIEIHRAHIKGVMDKLHKTIKK